MVSDCGLEEMYSKIKKVIKLVHVITSKSQLFNSIA